MFIPGQRWSSDTEPELGLGVIQEADERQVTVVFPAASEIRCYALASAPLHRVLFHPGETFKHQDGRSCRVESAAEINGLMVYRCGGVDIPETALADGQHRDQPLDRLWAGRASGPDKFDLRKAAAEWSHRLQAHPAYGFSGGKVQLIPHQFYIAGEVSRRAAPRVLLCDEVGLGKTIEALLILHRLWVSGKVKRVLILVPDALVHQWFVELFRRFNIRTRIIDAQHVEEHIDDSNVFDLESIVLCGIEWLSQQQTAGLAAVEAQWDMLIVDEAHHLHWSPEAAGPKYRLVEALCGHVPGVILLTATPEQLGRESHFARLRLLDPHRYHDLGAFLSETHTYRETAEKAAALDLAGKEDKLTELLDRHGPGRVVFRNTRAAIKGFPGREAHLVPLAPEKNACEKWLSDFLREHPTSKVVLICAMRETVT
ncbi:MAG: SNF2-related protein, partial [Verrucomicrobia bacterium]|nr:SNF2-related protein [Verrucomicrobiota bacterium]